MNFVKEAYNVDVRAEKNARQGEGEVCMTRIAVQDAVGSFAETRSRLRGCVHGS